MIVALALVFQVAAGEIDRAVADGIRRGAYPGAVVVVGTAGGPLFARGYGGLTWAADSPHPDPDSTLYDLASLTKVVATTGAVMRLVEGGRLDLDGPVRRYLPDLTGDGTGVITVRQLLEHRSGLRAFLPLHTLTASPEEARRRVLAEPVRWPPGTRVVYSDLNALLLGWIVERVSGRSLAEFAAESLFRPLGMHRTTFRPVGEMGRAAAPVGVWRGHPVAGAVHDQNAARLEGVAGHAGLFSTGADLARYARMLLRGGVGGDGVRLFREETVRRFTRPAADNRALGWAVNDTTSAEDTGHRLSPAAYGHTGFTGTSLWMDPLQDLYVIVLTNRVYAPRIRRSVTVLKEVRGRVADAAVRLRQERCGTLTRRCG